MQEPITRSLQLPILSLNSPRIHIPKGTSLTNCNHKHGLMSTCSREVASFYPYTEACSCRMAYFARKISKNRLVCKNSVALIIIGTLSIDNEMARRRRAEVKFSRARVLRMCDFVKTSSSLRRRLNFSRFSFW